LKSQEPRIGSSDSGIHRGEGLEDIDASKSPNFLLLCGSQKVKQKGEELVENVPNPPPSYQRNQIGVLRVPRRKRALSIQIREAEFVHPEVIETVREFVDQGDRHRTKPVDIGPVSVTVHQKAEFRHLLLMGEGCDQIV